MNNKRYFLYSILLRYSILIITALPNFWIFYFIFTPLTIYLSYFGLKLLFGAVLSGNLISIGNYSSSILIINACVAGSAYYLLLIFNLSVPNIRFLKRVKMVAFAFLTFLIVNVIRIILLSSILVLKPGIFDLTHKISWYIGSILLIIVIWFLEVKMFKVDGIPFYSDIKSIARYIK